LQNGDEYFGSWFWSNSVDVMVLASNYLLDRREEMENFKLSTVAKFLNIAVEDDALHDAQYDIELTKLIYDIVK
jgi:DNA polymerase-3 subunit epsilon